MGKKVWAYADERIGLAVTTGDMNNSVRMRRILTELQNTEMN